MRSYINQLIAYYNLLFIYACSVDLDQHFLVSDLVQSIVIFYNVKLDYFRFLSSLASLDN